MAKVYQLAVDATSVGTQANFDDYAHSLLFADSINPVYTQAENGVSTPAIVVTSSVESIDPSSAYYQLLADDSQSEVSVDISSGKVIKSRRSDCASLVGHHTAIKLPSTNLPALISTDTSLCESSANN